MIQVTAGLSINPAMVASVKEERRFYANGSATHLVITMADGKVYRLKHGYDIDVFAIKKKFSEAMGKSR